MNGTWPIPIPRMLLLLCGRNMMSLMVMKMTHFALLFPSLRRRKLVFVGCGAQLLLFVG
ncbi:hypothetical protein LINGRAHAP2_LOCUS20561 [Linum grandiflorum]